MLTYAEIHYRPRLMPSLLYSRWPEIICDAPTRIDPGRPLPVFLVIKDAHRYPVTIEAAGVRLLYENGEERVARFPYGALTVHDPLFWDMYNFMPEFPGRVEISISLLVRRGKRTVRVTVDNYRGLSHGPLTALAGTSPLPCAEGWFLGDPHCHTAYTDDQVEFGAPVEAAAYAAFCMGHHWMAATDHSYDLDDCPGDWTRTDQLLTKWKMLHSQAGLLSPTVTVIPGEEVTCRTSSGMNCHMLAIGSERFIPGSGDGGEKGLDRSTERSVGEAVRECVEWNGFACAAHPFERVPPLQRLLLRRGTWTAADLETPGLGAIQFHNGVRDRGFHEGMRAWTRLLLAGKRVAAIGGSDSHGDMNRRRRIVMPLVLAGEDRSHTFGVVRTAVQAKSRTASDILDGLRQGRAVVTEGPFLSLTVSGAAGAAGIGDMYAGRDGTVRATCGSLPEFGIPARIRLIAGTTGEREERVIAGGATDFSESGACVEARVQFDAGGYVRAECETSEGRFAFTNPVWICP